MHQPPFPILPRQVRCHYAEAATVPLLDFLCRRFNYLSRAEWTAQLREGSLRVDQQTAAPEQALLCGSVIEFTPRMLEEPPVCWDIDKIYETEELLLVNKPAPLPCHPAGPFFNHTLWAWLKQAENLPEVHFCNRLDRETSGLVLIGKNSKTASRLNLALQQPGPVKEYLVLVKGNFPPVLHCAGWLVPDSSSPVRKKRRFVENLPPEPPGGEAVCTDFACIAFHKREDISLLRAILHTGRMHQIRATLCSLGFPVIGDKLYGLDDRLFLKQAGNCLSEEDHRSLLLPHQALHAWKLRFCLPDQQTTTLFTAPVPEDLRTLLERLEFTIA